MENAEFIVTDTVCVHRDALLLVKCSDEHDFTEYQAEGGAVKKINDAGGLLILSGTGGGSMVRIGRRAARSLIEALRTG